MQAMNRITMLQKWAREQVSAKLGRCPRCMRAALLGAAGAWALAAGVSMVGLPALVSQLAVVIGLSFSALVVAHALAFVYRPAPIGGSCCGKPSPRLYERRPVLQAVLSLPAAFGLTHVLGVRWAAAKSGTELLPPATMRTAVFQNTLTCPDATGGTACQCTFTAYFGYDFKWLSATQIQVTRFTMRWAEGSTGTCEPEITRGSGAFDFQCVGDKQPCQFTGGNIFSCPCDTRIQFVPLTGTADECICPNTQNKTDYAQGVCGAPVWIEKTCTFQWIDLNFQHKVTCSCPDGHISRGFLTVVAQFSNGAIQFGGDWVPKTGLP